MQPMCDVKQGYIFLGLLVRPEVVNNAGFPAGKGRILALLRSADGPRPQRPTIRTGLKIPACRPRNEPLRPGTGRAR